MSYSVHWVEKGQVKGGDKKKRGNKKNFLSQDPLRYSSTCFLVHDLTSSGNGTVHGHESRLLN